MLMTEGGFYTAAKRSADGQKNKGQTCKNQLAQCKRGHKGPAAASWPNRAQRE
jgi:hypothetical protein